MNFDGSNEKNHQVDDLHQIDLNQYKMISKLDESEYLVSYKAIEKKSQLNFLVEVFKNLNDNVEHLIEKVKILSSFNSPFILKTKGYSLTDFDNNQNFAIISEYALNGTLENFLYENNKKEKSEWDDTKKLIFIYGIASGMMQIHSKNIIHKDLSSKNILIDEYLLPKIKNSENYFLNLEIEHYLVKGVGTLSYMSPELINEEEYDQKVDIYAFAVIVHYIIAGGLPKITLRDRMKGEKIPMNQTIPQHYVNLLNNCLEFDPKKRPTFNEIISILKTDKSFITDKIDEKEFYEFIESIENQNFKPKINLQKVYIEYPTIKELLVDINPIDLNKYEKQKIIGKGQFGKVFKIKEKSTGKIFAAKINIELIEECTYIQIYNLSREINILSKLNNLAILKFIGYNQNDFKNKSKPTIITEFSKNESLDNIINLRTRGLTPKEWNDTKILITTYGIAFGMAYLHSKNIIHRDIKPGNIFFDEYLFPKIGDFGLSKELNDESQFDYNNLIGTPAFMSPEIFNEFIYSKAGDVYAFGMLLYQMVTLEQPFKNLNFFQLCKAIVNKNRPKFNSDISNCYKKLIERCWLEDVSKRPTFDEIVNQLENDVEFITENVDYDAFLEYVQYLKNNQINKKIETTTIDFELLQKSQTYDPELNASYLDLSKYKKQKLIKRIDNFNIYEIKNIENNKLYEAKISTSFITNLTRNDLIHLSREINILSKINHPSFVKFIGYSPIDFNKKLLPVIVTEIPPNKSLDQLLQMERNQEHIKKWDATKKLINIYGISYGMKYLHSNKIIHRNLSPKSIFLDEYLFPKIGNFGLLTKIHSTESMTFQTSIGIKGNVSYSSPELLEHNEYSFSNDVYAFAFIVYEIITGDIPFNDINNNFNKLYDEVVNKSKRPKFKYKIEPQYRELIEDCWSQNPEDRPSFEKISSIIKNDSKFITKKINKEIFYKYTKIIEQSQENFINLNNQTVKFDKLIQNEFSNNEIIEEELKNKYISTKQDKITIKEQLKDNLNEDKNLEIINEYLYSKQPDKLMELLNDLNDEEFVSSIFNKCQHEHPDIYLDLCKKGIQLNNAIAHHKYALTLIFSPNSNKSTFEEARNHLEESIKKGFSLSYFSLARLLHEYFNENSRAIELLKKGSEKGEKYSRCLLGYFISHGIGIKKDLEKGVQMMLNSKAEEFYSIFASDIGTYYAKLSKESSNQEERIKLSQEAFKWFELAYKRNKSKATINNYGICFMIGFGIQKNIEKAKEIFLNGAKQGDLNSFYHLGYIYENINTEKSYQYYNEAAKGSHFHAKLQIKYIKRKK